MWMVLLLLGLLMPPAAVASPGALLDIAVDSAGAAHVRAVLELSARPAVVHAVLTDYAHWPLLFPRGLRIMAISQEKDGVDETRAELEMDIQLKQWIPGWLFTLVLKHELLEHFGRLQAEVASHLAETP